jgi:superfamily I DNA and/or RNA helicase
VQFNRFILIGDQNQLPAVTVQGDKNTKIIDPDLNGIGISDMKVSFFERLFNNAVSNGWTNAYGTLKEQFRMNETIMDLINHFYHGKLICAITKPPELNILYKYPDDSPLSNLLCNYRIIFIETPYSPSGKMNEFEAEYTAKLMLKINEIGYLKNNKDLNVGVITPWRAQIASIRQKLEENCITDIPVDTVERFQGSENKVIIYSTSVSARFQLERMGSIGINKNKDALIEVDRKLNVVLSRAQEQIIIMGSSEVLRISIHYRKLIEMIIQKGKYITRLEAIKLFGT